MKYTTAAALFLFATPALGQTPAPNQNMEGVLVSAPDNGIPLTVAEITDAHNCFMGTMLAICAGDKKISTGIILASRMAMEPVPNWWLTKLPDDEKIDMRWPHAEIVHTEFAAVSMLQQTAPNPEWRKSYYVVDDDQLRRIVENARRDPNYDPTK